MVAHSEDIGLIFGTWQFPVTSLLRKINDSNLPTVKSESDGNRSYVSQS